MEYFSEMAAISLAFVGKAVVSVVEMRLSIPSVAQNSTTEYAVKLLIFSMR